MNLRTKFLLMLGIPVVGMALIFVIGFTGFRNLGAEIEHVTAVENAIELMVNADRDAYQALLAHPLVPNFRVARALLADILEANRDFLPQFLRT